MARAITKSELGRLVSRWRARSIEEEGKANGDVSDYVRGHHEGAAQAWHLAAEALDSLVTESRVRS